MLNTSQHITCDLNKIPLANNYATRHHNMYITMGGGVTKGHHECQEQCSVHRSDYSGAIGQELRIVFRVGFRFLI